MKDQKCCGGNALSRRLECCGKGPLSKPFDPRREHCCVARGFAEVYSPVEQICCGNEVILKRLVCHLVLSQTCPLLKVNGPVKGERSLKCKDSQDRNQTK